jgi:hypothetical protein
MKQRLLWFTKALFVVAVVLFIPQVALASAYVAGGLVQVSGTSPFDANCGLVAGQPGTNYPNSEVEPHVDVNPFNGDNLIGAWQQDRWSDGGSRGNVVGASFDNGATWLIVPETKNSQCTGGTPENGGDYQRASDPWVTISPDGTAYLMSLSIDQDPTSVFGANPDAMLVSKSTNGGQTWSDPITLIRDTNPNRLNDKNTMTAHPRDPNLVYAVWDRLESPPSGNMNPTAGENAIAFRGPTLFTRTTNGGASWEEPRIIFDPGTLQQTLGNQIVVRPQGDLINIFNLIQTTRKGATRGFNVSVIRSEDNGATWSKPIRFERMVNPGVSDPEGGFPVRTGDIIPDIAVDPTTGQLYAVWQDKRFSDGQHDSIALSTSFDGGLSWTAAVKVNKTPMEIPSGNQQAFTPAVDVAQDGTVSVSYYDFRNNTPDPNTLPTDYWVVHCHAATDNCSDGLQYGNEIRLTDTSFDMERAPVARGYFVGDYEGLANDIGAEGTNFAPFFSQTHEADPASIFFRRVGPEVAP